MNKDLSWTEAAQRVLEEAADAWLSVPNIVRKIREQEIKQLNEISHDRACRCLRSCMLFHSRKENGLFIRRESRDSADHTSIAYALRQRVRSSTRSKSPSVPVALSKKTVDPPANGCAEEELDCSIYPSMVEIDPTVRPGKGLRKFDSLMGFCVPSPLRSLLGPSRTLHAASAATFPYRGVRSRKIFTKDGEKKDNDRNEEGPKCGTNIKSSPSLPNDVNWDSDSKYLMMTHQLEVVFVKLDEESDPRCIQGSRIATEILQICPDEVVSSSGTPAPVLVQRTPTTQLLRRASLVQVHTTSPGSTQNHHISDVVNDVPCSLVDRKCEPPSFERQLQCASSISHVVQNKSNQSLYLPLLFSAASPLVDENLKNLLNMSSFERLTGAQRQALMALLPQVDRGENSPSQSSFTHEFFSRSLREWQERLLQGVHNVDYRSRAKYEDRRRLKTEENWKKLYYEKYWGDRLSSQVDSSFVPYYPVTEAALASSHLSCLEAIRKGCQSCKDQNEVLGVPTPSVPLTIVKPDKNWVISCVKRSPLLKPSRSTKHVLKSITAKKLKKIFEMNQDTKSAMLTSLPPKTSYQSLLAALHQACRENSSLPTASPVAAPPSPCALSLPHKHSVFHDHFSTFSIQHIPIEFSDPIDSLLVSLPREIYTRHILGKVVMTDHNYSDTTLCHQPSFKLSVPRSLLTGVCMCDGIALIFCAQCHSMYHASCTQGSLCPACLRT